MIRSVGTTLVGTVVLAALVGCAAGQDSFRLPELTPQAVASGVQVYPGLGYGNGYGYGIGGGYGYPNGYQLGYGYADPFYAGQGPYPYGYNRYSYSPYPRYVVVPCQDNNRDGRCDGSPTKDHGHHGNDGRDRDHNRNHDRDDRPVPPRYARSVVPNAEPDAGSDNKRRARRDVAPVVQPQSAPPPAPEVKQPARVRPEPRREASPTQEP